ncbi:Bax inhibitor-1/YccA family protein [Porticoccus sp. W117]|uniref:Bax inhibitor-1/YccA family protein n=1 Tax=Porticoccus sp. W117 TaxID=3054777 RepID=UPI0025991C23|nr:Bax inhibitor-1/YccA family protein [Porticoccus sp. W117]MDM3871699.1 Bax inhibitor-1/YccA family protein [Porticoccus sp. W117]
MAEQHYSVSTKAAATTAPRGIESAVEINKVLKNTYLLLSMTLLFSAAAAWLSTTMEVGHGLALGASIAAIVVVWFVLPRTANSAAGLPVVFLFTGLLGFSLGPILNHYLSMPNGSSVVMQALGSTAAVFLILSAYVINTKKDFTFLKGFLFTGFIIVFLSSIGLAVASLFGVQLSGAFLAVNALSALVFSGFILFDTSRIVNGGERNYIMATTQLYLDIHILFTNLLHLIGFADD